MAQAHNVIKEARRVKGLKLNNGKIRGQDLLRYIDFGNWVNIVCEEYLVVFPPAPDACSSVLGSQPATTAAVAALGLKHFAENNWVLRPASPMLAFSICEMD